MAAAPGCEGRVVLVTGGARGIGAGIVRAFGEPGTGQVGRGGPRTPIIWMIDPGARGVRRLVRPDVEPESETRAASGRALSTALQAGGRWRKGLTPGGVQVENGAKVIICDKDEASGQALEKELLLAKPPAGARFIQCDVTKEGEVAVLISDTLRLFGRLDCVVNNAGHHPPEEALEDTSSQAFRELLELNLLAVYTVTKHALPFLRQSRGSIINISSLVGAIGQRKAAPYVATKGAVTALSKALALDESQYGVRVNCISPGNIWTPLWEELAAQTPDPPATVREGEQAQPLGRMGRPDEVGAAAVFLAFQASFCTGVELPLTGGAELGYGRKVPPPERT